MYPAAQQHITVTFAPAVANCTACSNQLIGRQDSMPTTRVQAMLPGKTWPTLGWYCASCAAARGYQTAASWLASNP